MSKIDLNTIGSLTNEQSAISLLNLNSQEIETKSDTFLSRDGVTPNHMEADLDMNSNDILNVGNVTFAGGGGITTTFLALTDTPDTYVGQSLKTVRVNVGETGLEFATGGGGAGDVTGPASSTDNAIVRFDGTTGKIIQNSLVTINDGGDLLNATSVIIASNTFDSGIGFFQNLLVNKVSGKASQLLTAFLSAESPEIIFMNSRGSALEKFSGEVRMELPVA